MLWALFLTLALLDGQAEHAPDKPAAKTIAQRSAQPSPKVVTAALPSPTPSLDGNREVDSNDAQASDAQGNDVDIVEDRAAEGELLERANQSRQQIGLPALRRDESLNAAAREHARLMVENARLDLRFQGELPLLERIAQVSPLYLDRAGENVAYNSSAARAHQALMLSPPHRQNLLNPRFNVAGMAAFWSAGRLYVVQDFGHQVVSDPSPQPVQPSSPHN